jgi:hypothetical protein
MIQWLRTDAKKVVEANDFAPGFIATGILGIVKGLAPS